MKVAILVALIAIAVIVALPNEGMATENGRNSVAISAPDVSETPVPNALTSEQKTKSSKYEWQLFKDPSWNYRLTIFGGVLMAVLIFLYITFVGSRWDIPVTFKATTIGRTEFESLSLVVFYHWDLSLNGLFKRLPLLLRNRLKDQMEALCQGEIRRLVGNQENSDEVLDQVQSMCQNFHPGDMPLESVGAYSVAMKFVASNLKEYLEKNKASKEITQTNASNLAIMAQAQSTAISRMIKDIMENTGASHETAASLVRVQLAANSESRPQTLLGMEI